MFDSHEMAQLVTYTPIAQTKGSDDRPKQLITTTACNSNYALVIHFTVAFWHFWTQNIKHFWCDSSLWYSRIVAAIVVIASIPKKM